jgi:hypothetical protein
MGFEIDKSLHWSDHYVEYGFCVIKGAIDKEFCRRGIEEFKKALGTDLPPQQWTTESLQCEHSRGRLTRSIDIQPFIQSVYDEPGLRSAIDTMLGSPDQWSGERACHPFVCLFDPANEPVLPEWGHVDFVEVRIPILGNGFAMQVSLIDTEPFSGNITIYPGYHKVVQEKLLQEPGYWFGNEKHQQEAWRRLVPHVEPYEFVAEAGDVLFFHHLVGHAGNLNAAANHTPRVAIHGQVLRKEWLNAIDPAQPNLSPFERSLALNGPIQLPFDEREAQQAAYKERDFRWKAEKWASARMGVPARYTPK